MQRGAEIDALRSIANDELMDDRELAWLAEDNLIRAIECWARAAGGEVHDLDPAYVSTAPVSMRSFNQIIVREPVSADQLREAITLFRGRERFRLRVLEAVGVGPAAEEAGLVLQGGIPSLVLEAPERQDLASYDVREVDDEPTLAHHVAIVAAAFDWDSPELGAVFTPKLLADEAWQAWVLYEAGEPVATAQLVTAGETAGIYYVGTLEAKRGKGYGAAVTRACVDEAARKGCRMVGLQASPLGRPVYEHLGFRVVAEYETYVPA